VSGFSLLFPFSVAGVNGMQIVQVVHALIAAVMVAIIIAHIYIGTLGMEGAFDAMATGWVDENWAWEHHRTWVRQQRAETGDGVQQAAE
jgi:formate dehydrogenase subunit gamma